jgi:hypothetical protein
MTALPPVANVVKLQFQHTINNVPVFVHWFLKYSGGAPVPTDMVTYLNSAASAWSADAAPVSHPQVTLTGIVGTDLTTPSSAQAQITTTRGGTRTGGPLTANDCVLLNMKIARRYRGGKPRQYWPWGTDADVADAQHWSAGATAAFGTAWQNFQTALLAAALGPATVQQTVNVSYYQGVITPPLTLPSGRVKNRSKLGPSPPYPITDSVTAVSINSRIATQRRRQHFSL